MGSTLSTSPVERVVCVLETGGSAHTNAIDAGPASSPAGAALLSNEVANGAILFIALIAAAFSLYVARAVLLPVALASVLALTLRPVVRYLKRYKVPHFVASLSAMGAVLLLLAALLFWLLAPAQQWVDNLPTVTQSIRAKLKPFTQRWAEWTESAMPDEAASNNTVPPIAVEVKESFIGSNLAIASTTGEAISTAVIVIVLSFFMLAGGDDLLRSAITTMHRFTSKKLTVELIYDIESVIASYLFVVSCINLGLGVVTALSFYLLGVPNPLLWGAVALIANYIPLFGPMAAFVLYVIVSIVTFDTLLGVIMPPLVFTIISQIEGNLLTPMLLGKSMSLNPILVLLSLVFWGWLWGIGGAILAVPILAMFKVACEKVDALRSIAVIIGNTPGSSVSIVP